MTKMHAFAIASRVAYRPLGQPEQEYTVVRHLPADRGDLQYCLRSAAGQERVVEEALLSKATSADDGS